MEKISSTYAYIYCEKHRWYFTYEENNSGNRCALCVAITTKDNKKGENKHSHCVRAYTIFYVKKINNSHTFLNPIDKIKQAGYYDLSSRENDFE